MVINSNFSDLQHQKTSLLEYQPLEMGQDYSINDGDDYIGNLAHIYDNVNGNEEQVFVLTNNGQGEKQKAVPYDASDEARAQVHDVTVLMKGSETETSTDKLLHDTVTDWLRTDLPVASNILGPAGAANYTTDYMKRFVRDKIKENVKKGAENDEKITSEIISYPFSLMDKNVGNHVKNFVKGIKNNSITNAYHDAKANLYGMGSDILIDTQAKFPVFVGAAFLQQYNKDKGTFPPPQFKDAATHLKEVIQKYPNAKIDLYGHSLGSMDIQYALACLTEEEAAHVGTVHVYNGPNIYNILTSEQKKRLDALKYKIYNHIDHKDLVSLGYPESGSKGASGIVKQLKTKNLINIGLQHMMHGYIYDQNGNLVLEKGTEAITRKEIIEERMKVYYRLKDKLEKTGGGLSSNEKIYLDALQTRLATDELIRVVDEGLDQAQKLKTHLASDLENVEKALHTVPSGLILSPTEIEEAYATAGATRQTLVTEVKEKFDRRLSTYQSLSQEFHTFKEQVNSGIELLKAKDQEIAGEMNQWDQLAY